MKKLFALMIFALVAVAWGDKHTAASNAFSDCSTSVLRGQ